MKNNKSINIYMGIIGEAYVDKETAYAVLLAAKKNILDVKAIINSANALFTPLAKAISKAAEAKDSAFTVYNMLKNAIADAPKDSAKYVKLCALLSNLNVNDLNDDPETGGNIYTALENMKFAESLQGEINSILTVAKELLDANELNAVVRCKEYNIAKEIFESMIPEKQISPEELSDVMESELIKRINNVQDNIDYVNIVSDEINNISQEVTNKIGMIQDGTDEFVASTNESLYWFAGSINPSEDSEFMESYGFEMPTGSTTWRMFKKDEYGEYVLDENGRKIDVDFGIAGPLRKNNWFKQPLHLLQDGELIAGVDGKLRSSEKYWYVTVPHFILTNKGLQEYKNYVKNIDSNTTVLSQYEWAADWMSQYTDEEYQSMLENESDSVYVVMLYPVTPPASTNVPEHTDYEHAHPMERNEWIDTNENGIRDNEDIHKNGYELIDSTLSINGIVYDTWRVNATIYNKQRLNVYFNIGKLDHTSSDVNEYYWYVGTKKLTGFSDDWMLIQNADGETYTNNIDSNVFYVAVPESFGIYEYDTDQTENANSAESMYTYVYSLSMNKVKYDVYVTGNSSKTFNGVVKPKNNTIEIPTYVTLTYNNNGVNNAIVPNAQTVIINTQQSLPVLAAVIDNNKQYVFQGWSLTADGEIVASPYEVTEDTTLYAIWEEKDIFTVSFDVNGGNVSEQPEDINAVDGETITLPNAITKASTDEFNYTFAGWQLDSTIYEAGAEFTVTANATFIAQWLETETEPIEPIEGVYYWYVGQTNPSTMSSISPIVVDNSSPGWRLIGTTIPAYSSSNKLWDATDIITTGDSLAKQYIAIPADSTACPRDGAGYDASTVDIYTKLSNKTIDGVEYKVYETIGKMKKHNLDIF